MKRFISLIISLLTIQYCWAADVDEVTDFKYEYDSKTYIRYVTGLSDQGKAKISGKTGVSLDLPSKDADGNTVVAVKANAFSGTNITYLTIPSNYQNINSNAFKDCKKLKEVWIKSNINYENLAANSFNGCTALSDVNLSDCYNLVSNYFSKKINLRTIFPNATNFVLGTSSNYNLRIGKYAFCKESAEKLSVQIPTGAYIGDSAFYGNENVRIINAPSGIGQSAFGNDSKSAKVNIPFSKQITSIADSAFFNCASIHASLTGEWHLEGCQTIGSDAFCPVDNNSTVELYLGANTIGTNAFARVNVTAVHLTSNVFVGATYTSSNNLKTYFPVATTFYLNASKIGDYALYNNGNVTTVYLESNVKSIGKYAFCRCSNLKTVKDNATSLSSIAVSAFYMCTSLETADFSNVTSLGNHCFANCSMLNNAILPSLTAVPNSCFENDAKLVYVSTAEAKTIGQSAFKNCTSFTNWKGIDIYQFRNLESIEESAFENCAEIEYSPFMESSKIKSIGAKAFYNCPHIGYTGYFFGSKDENITRPIETIGDKAFSGTGVKVVNLPSTLTSLGDSVFPELEKLTVDNSSLLSGDGCIFDKLKLKNDGNSILIVGGPEGKYNIGEDKFHASKMLNLKQMEIGDNVAKIMQYGFYNITAESITIGENASIGINDMTKIQMKCKKLVAKGTKIFQSNYFEGESNLFTVFGRDLETIDNKFKGGYIDAYAFCTPEGYTSSLKKVNASFAMIFKSAFEGNPKLEYNGLENAILISEKAFKGCNNKFYSSNNTYGVVINAYAFANNPLCAIEIYKENSQIDANAFEDCKPRMVYDETDKVLMESNKEEVKMITATEERAKFLRNNGYKYCISGKRMSHTAEDVNIDGSLSGDDVQLIYNAMK